MSKSIFEANPNLKKCYQTSDGEFFYNQSDAKLHASSLKGKKVETLSRPLETIKPKAEEAQKAKEAEEAQKAKEAEEAQKTTLAADLIELINKAETEAEVDELAKGDTRSTVIAAAKEKKKSFA